MTHADPMTVGELIAHLQAFPPEMPVMVDGYEGGMDYPLPPMLESAARNKWDSAIFGRYDSSSEVDAVQVVYIPR